MIDFMKFLVESGIATASFILGALCIITGIIGKVGKLIEASNKQRFALILFGALLLEIGFQSCDLVSIASGEPQTGAISTSQVTAESSLSPTAPVPSVTATVESQTVASPCEGRIRPETPCLWTIEGNDSYESVSTAVYGDRQHMLILINLNRDDKGYRSVLVPGEELFVPNLASVPDLDYSACVEGETGALILPCIHDALSGDTYSIIARRVYRQQSYAGCIQKANYTYDGVYIRPISSSYDDDVGGYSLVVPVPALPCE